MKDMGEQDKDQKIVSADRLFPKHLLQRVPYRWALPTVREHIPEI